MGHDGQEILRPRRLHSSLIGDFALRGGGQRQAGHHGERRSGSLSAVCEGLGLRGGQIQGTTHVRAGAQRHREHAAHRGVLEEPRRELRPAPFRRQVLDLDDLVLLGGRHARTLSCLVLQSVRLFGHWTVRRHRGEPGHAQHGDRDVLGGGHHARRQSHCLVQHGGTAALSDQLLCQSSQPAHRRPVICRMVLPSPGPASRTVLVLFGLRTGNPRGLSSRCAPRMIVSAIVADTVSALAPEAGGSGWEEVQEAMDGEHGTDEATDGRPGSADATPHEDPVLVALADLVDAAEQVQRTTAHMITRAAKIQAGRAQGLTYRELVGRDEPLIAALLTDTIHEFEAAGTRFRREQARALHKEGLTMEQIGALFGLTRQRISVLLRARPVEPHTPLSTDGSCR